MTDSKGSSTGDWKCCGWAIRRGTLPACFGPRAAAHWAAFARLPLGRVIGPGTVGESMKPGRFFFGGRGG